MLENQKGMFMKNRVLILIISVLAVFVGICVFAVATDFVGNDAGFGNSAIPDEYLYFEDYTAKNVRLFAKSDDNPPYLDYSLLDHTFTVEVENAVAAGAFSLVVVEYDANDAPVNIHIIKDVKTENVIENVHGEYEKAFLWNFSNMCPACVSISTKTDYEIIEGEDGDWSVSPDGHTLYAYLGEDTDVIVPNSYHGKRIRDILNQPAIAARTAQTTYGQMSIFGGRTDITSFVIPEGIVRLGPCSFSECSASCPITIPDTVTYIGNYAFRNCTNLTGSLDLSGLTTFQTSAGLQFAFCRGLDGTLIVPEVEIIPKYAFYDCRNLQGGINIPSGVKEIGEYAFSCDAAAKFTSLSLPDTLERIGKAAFQRQASIQNELILPEGLEHIGDAAFNHCGSISNTTLTIPQSLSSIGGDAAENTGYGCHVFYDAFKNVSSYEVAAGNEYFKSESGVLYSKDGTRLVTYPPAKADSTFTVPEGVTQIDEMSLSYSRFTTLYLPDSYVISETVPENVVNNKANTLAASMYHYNNLKNVFVKETNPNYLSINGILYSKDKSKLWYIAPKVTGGITIVDECTEIMQGACWMEENDYRGEIYTSIYIPSSVMTINENTLNDLNRKTNNSQTRFIINLDSANRSFIINSEGKICAL